MDDWCYDIHDAVAAQDRAAVTAAVLRALELAAELLPVRVWGVVEIRKESYVKRTDKT